MLATATTQTAQPIFERDQLIRGHLEMAKRLARKIARRIPPSVGLDELESAALLGLTEAASRFDPSRGEPFAAYAAKRIRGAVLDDLRRRDVLTRRGREGARRLADATRSAEHRVGGPAATEDVASELGVAADDVGQARGRLEAASLVPIDELTDVSIAGNDEAPDAACARQEEKRALVRALGELPERDLLVLSMYYRDGLNLKEIGEILAVSESRVCQIRSRTLKALKSAIESEGA